MTEGATNHTTARTLEARSGAHAAGLRLSPGIRWKITQASADFATVFGASMLAYWLYLRSGIGQAHFSPFFYANLNLVLAFFSVFALFGIGEYSRAFGLLRIDSIRRIVVASASAVLLLLAVSFLIQLPNFSRLTVLMLAPASVLGLTAQRFCMWWVQDRIAASNRTPVLVYGAGETGRLLAQNLLGDHHLGLSPAGFLDDDPMLRGKEIRVGAGIRGERVPVLGGEADLERIVRRLDVGMVFLAMPSAPSDRIAHLVALLEAKGIPYYGVPTAGDLLFSSLRFGQLAGMPVFTRRQPNADRFYEMVKRSVDLALGAALLAAVSPALILASLLVKLSSRGPVLFRQQRTGQHGAPFTIYKLRTMYAHSPTYGEHPTRPDDRRVTRVGFWLRRLSLDELPQLLNVLRGEMSLVGPRPEMPLYVKDYDEIQRLRLTVKPGMTGLWQISADRAFRIHDNIQYDLYYVDRRSISLDLAILIATPFVLLAKNRAM